MSMISAKDMPAGIFQPAPTPTSGMASQSTSETQTPPYAHADSTTAKAVFTDKESPLITESPNALAPYIQELNALVYWENPFLSSVVFVGSTSFVLLIQYLVHSIFSLTGFALFAITAFHIAYVVAVRLVQSLSGNKIRNPNQARARKASLEWTEADVLYVASILLTALNQLIRPVAQMFLASDLKTSFQAAAVFYALWHVASWIPSTHFILLSLVAIFTLPLVHMRFENEIQDAKRQVEATMHRACNQICTMTYQTKEAIMKKFSHVKKRHSPKEGMKKEE